MHHDSQLIEQTLQGDDTAFATLVARYQPRLFTTLFHVTGTREDAEDVGQEALAQAYVKLSSFQQKSSFYTWLYRIACNLWVSHRRKRRIEDVLTRTREDQGNQALDPGESPAERVLREERAVAVYAALETLPPDYRSILVLREMEGYRYEQIAEILELPIGTVRSRLHRARVQLSEQLKETHQASPAES
ncbi:MAG: sigma-70 family RNA polymerase sigma factor [Planctomycetota bacterium]|nr:sigma-70 family RNA polymerase sigma factor [Planctomycetota bacterium]